MKKISLNIMGRNWTAKLLDCESFIEENPDCEDSAAVVIPAKKEIHFNADDIDLGVIRHEVRHVFLDSLCLSDADLDMDQFEEINCVLDQERWDEMDEVSAKIYENFILT